MIASWWVWQRSQANYQTLANVIAIVAGALLVSAWFSERSGVCRRLGRAAFVGLWVAVGLAWLFVKPIYNGDMGIVGWRWRFAATPDARLTGPKARHRIDDWQTTSRDYPRFLGGGDWPEVRGVRLETDWQTHPPLLQWRREIGAGWGGFAIVGNYAFTQEQRGPSELVSCYRIVDGSPVWTHADEVRFDPAGAGGLGGIGPRATPTVVGERVFTQGATGLVNCLDVRTGDVLWSHDTIEETGAALLTWGKSGSPLVADDLVIISVGAPPDAAADKPAALDAGGTVASERPQMDRNYHSSLVAYEAATGEVRWSAGARQASYATPVLTTLAGERQIVCINEHQTTAHRLSDGQALWEYPWPGEADSTATCTQPVPVGDERLFVSKGYGVGASLLEVSRSDAGKWRVQPVWSPPVRQVMKTKFSNVVVRDGFVYGLDDVLLECLELKSGRVAWKHRRQPEIGHGQILLVGDAILVLSEFGELALIEATPERYHEMADILALDPADVTWNTPAFAPPYLLIRNAREAACYRLPLKD